MPRSLPLLLACCPLLVGGLAGCATHAGTGALVGSGFGAVTGSMIGHATGSPLAGTVIGATAGALAGGAIGDAEDAREERDAAIVHAQHLEWQNQRLQNELHNVDLIRMTQSGLGDDVIIGAVRSRGGSFDLSPDGLIALKSNGVSDAVIVEVQRGSAVSGPIVPVSVVDPAPVVLEPVVVVPPRPRPRIDISIGGRPHRHRPPFHHHHW